LKLALLYFDGIYRITPRNISPRDTAAILEVVEKGLLEEILPEEKYVKEAGEKFEKEFLPLLEQGISETIGLVKDVANAFSRYNLHLDKMRDKVRKKLESLGLAQTQGDWLLTDAYVAGSYMMCLATVMSESMK
jgi:hypothetical protein